VVAPEGAGSEDAAAQLSRRQRRPRSRARPVASAIGTFPVTVSLDNVAGIRNAEGNVLGLMPHPERCAEDILGNDAGRVIFLSMLDALKKAKLKSVLA